MAGTLTFVCSTHLRWPPSPGHPSLFATKRFQSLIKAQTREIRVCTNRTCRRQGSFQTLETLTALAPPTVTVKSCGCLGRCGAGPNVAVVPDGLVLSHCGTAARAAEMMLSLCSAAGFGGGGDASDPPYDTSKSLEALALMKRAESEMEKGNFHQAELLLSQGIDLRPLGGIHIMYKNRSVARLALGNHSGALEDAREALTLAPQYLEAYICQGDAFVAMDHFDLAKKSYLTSLEIDPSIRRAQSFKARVAKLQEKLTSVNMP